MDFAGAGEHTRGMMDVGGLSKCAQVFGQMHESASVRMRVALTAQKHLDIKRTSYDVLKRLWRASSTWT